MNNQNSNQTETSLLCSVGWSQVDRKKIASSVYPLIEMQKAYGRQLDLELIMKGWQAVLSDYSADHVCYALKVYMKKSSDFPAPADLIKILEPEEPKITESQYVQACKQQERNGWLRFSYEQGIIDDYRKQNAAKHESYEIESETIKKLINVKRIEG